MSKPEYSVDITNSDVKPGVVLLTFNRSDGEYIGVKLQGAQLQEFVHAMVKAYTTAVAEQGEVSTHIALKQIDTFITEASKALKQGE